MVLRSRNEDRLEVVDDTHLKQIVPILCLTIIQLYQVPRMSKDPDVGCNDLLQPLPGYARAATWTCNVMCMHLNTVDLLCVLYFPVCCISLQEEYL